MCTPPRFTRLDDTSSVSSLFFFVTTFCEHISKTSRRGLTKPRGFPAMAAALVPIVALAMNASLSSDSREQKTSPPRDACFVRPDELETWNNNNNNDDDDDDDDKSRFVVGALENVSVAVKDNIDVAGFKTGCGNPQFLRDFSPRVKRKSAPLIERLIDDAGGTLVGKTHMDELAWSLQGENHHYGTPKNGRAPDRIPGGSSSGSASAVSQGLAELAVGTDTAGSVRVPASFCGICSIRLTHDFDERMCREGIVPLAKSFDVPGFFGKNVDILLRATRAVFANDEGDDDDDVEEEENSNSKIDDDDDDDVTFVKLEDAFALATEEARTAIESFLQKNDIEYENITLGNENILEWWDDFRIQQTDDVWKAHGEWIRKRHPFFGPGVNERFYGAEMVSKDTENVARARDSNKKRAEIILNEVFRTNTSDAHHRTGKIICVVPAAACAPPLLNEDASIVNDLRVKTLSLSCISGLTGLPQVVVPCVSNKNDLPIGVGFIGWERNCDVALLETLVEKLNIDSVV